MTRDIIAGQPGSVVEETGGQIDELPEEQSNTQSGPSLPFVGNVPAPDVNAQDALLSGLGPVGLLAGLPPGNGSQSGSSSSTSETVNTSDPPEAIGGQPGRVIEETGPVDEPTMPNDIAADAINQADSIFSSVPGGSLFSDSFAMSVNPFGQLATGETGTDALEQTVRDPTDAAMTVTERTTETVETTEQALQNPEETASEVVNNVLPDDLGMIQTVIVALVGVVALGQLFNVNVGE